MIWHIVRKDFRLLRGAVLALAAVQVVLAAARAASGHFQDVRALDLLAGLPGGLLVLLATAFVVAAAVHQDALPGVHQDWLVRPVRRTDLLGAKVLFVLLMIHGPMLATDVLQGLASGFSPGASAVAAATRGLYVLLTFSLPVLAIGALTRDLTEFVVGLAAWLGAVVSFLVLPSLTGWASPTAMTGLAWVPEVTRQGLLLLGALAVLALQYFRRTTTRARVLLAGAILVGQLMRFLPWTAALAAERWFTPSPGAGASVALSFEPSLGRFRPALGLNVDDVAERPGLGPVDVAEMNARRRADGAVTVFLPLRATGAPAESRVVTDRSEVRVLDGAGATLYRGSGNDLQIRSGARGAPGPSIHHGIRIPSAVYRRIKDLPVRLQADYSLTLFTRNAVHAMPARDGDQRMPGIGWCATRVNPAGTAVQFRCLQPGERPSCLTLELYNGPSGRRNPEVSLCVPDYKPFPGHAIPDALSRFGGTLAFSDSAGLARYPVSGAMVSESQVIVTSYRLQDHFTRRVVVAEMRLRDWEPEPQDPPSGQPR